MPCFSHDTFPLLSFSGLRNVDTTNWRENSGASPEGAKSTSNSPESFKSVSNSPEGFISVSNSPEGFKSVSNSPESFKSVSNSPEGSKSHQLSLLKQGQRVPPRKSLDLLPMDQGPKLKNGSSKPTFNEKRTKSFNKPLLRHFGKTFSFEK